LLGLYRGKAGTHRERIFASFVSPTRHRLNVRCIRTERYKLIHHLTTDEVELYDLKEDPYELNNLARQKRFSKLKKRLMAELLAWRTKAESKAGLSRRVRDTAGSPDASFGMSPGFSRLRTCK
jgi:hypothetical protein